MSELSKVSVAFYGDSDYDITVDGELLSARIEQLKAQLPPEHRGEV